MDLSEARRFLAVHHNGVLATRKRDGGLQMSPVTVGVDDGGRAVVSSRETAYKTRNLRRDSRASLCVFADSFHGSVWIQINGTAQIVSLPEAMAPLVDFQRRVKGGHPDWDEYRRTMERQRRVVIRVAIDTVGPDRRG